MAYGFLKYILYTVCNIVPLLIAVAFYTLAERKVMAGIQRRRGPNIVGVWGLLQPFADGLKLILKEIVLPRKANKVLFLFAPVLTLFISLAGWSIIPFCFNNDKYTAVTNSSISNPALGILLFFAITSLGVYGILLAGWASNSKYAFIGTIRAIAQMLSYELSFGLILISVILCCGTLNLEEIVSWQQRGNVWLCEPLLPLTIIFFICILAETNRAPFDLPEAEAEIVAGYNVEYSSIVFALFFLGEYSSMLLMSSFFIIVFLGGWLPILYFKSLPYSISFLTLHYKSWFAIKLIFICFIFILVRSSFPRYRYDQLMDIGWKIFLPITVGYIFFISGILIAVGGLPYSSFLQPIIL